MRNRTTQAIAILLVLAAACASTPQQKELQYAQAIITTNDSTAQAVDFGIIDPDTAEAIQAITRTATADLKRAVAARRAGRSPESYDRILSIVRDALLEASRILEARQKRST